MNILEQKNETRNYVEKYHITQGPPNKCFEKEFLFFTTFSLSYLYFTRSYHKTVKSLTTIQKWITFSPFQLRFSIFRFFFVQFPWTAVFNPRVFMTKTTNIISSLIEGHWSWKYKHSYRYALNSDLRQHIWYVLYGSY